MFVGVMEAMGVQLEIRSHRNQTLSKKKTDDSIIDEFLLLPMLAYLACIYYASLIQLTLYTSHTYSIASF